MNDLPLRRLRTLLRLIPMATAVWVCSDLEISHGFVLVRRHCYEVRQREGERVRHRRG